MVIRYRGKIANDKVVKPMLKFVRGFAKNQGWKIMEWKDEGAMFAQKTTSNQGFHRTLGKVEQEGVILNLGPIGQF